MTYDKILDTVLTTLDKHLTTKSVIGEPLTVGDVTMIPVMDLMFGYGGGAGEGKDEKDSGGGGGGGAGARLAPKALVVIKNGEVQVLPFSKGSAVEKIVEAIPAIMEKFTASRAAKQEPAAE